MCWQRLKRKRQESQMPRGARLDTPGTLHHVMVRGIKQGSIVPDDIDGKGTQCNSVEDCVLERWFEGALLPLSLTSLSLNNS